MPIPTSISDLSTTAASNSPQGSESPTEGDNYIRALSAIIAQESLVKANLTAMASTASASDGDALLGQLRTATGAGATTVHASKEADEYNAKGDFLVAFDNATNNQTGMASGLATGRDLYLIEGVARVGTGSLSPAAKQRVYGSGRENTFLRTTHASNPVFDSTAQFVTYEGFTVDRSGAIAGSGIRHVAVNNATPLEGLKIVGMNLNGHATGFYTRDFVIQTIQDSYVQSGTVGIDIDKTGANFSTVFHAARLWVRGNTTTGMSLAGSKNTLCEQVVYEGAGGVVTDLGLSVSGGGVHLQLNPWFESLDLAATFVNCGETSLYGGYLDGLELDAHAFYVIGNTLATTVIFDGPWETANFSGTFAIADQGATIRVRAPALLTKTFSAVNGGKVIFECALEARATWNPANCASLAKTASTTVTVTGARLGDLCEASFENGTTDPQNFLFKADCFSNDTVTVSGFNFSAGALDLASGTLSVRVQKRALTS